ncbi:MULTISPECIES: hypothetical protein [unclassified Bordetella]|uniref:hypothetical protein n=1 Tax=unclassified Bordetella TaxID=2630031 RepID=UPI0013215206|nr:MULTISPECIES: hypothetical protein [unclassified Bordetella]MVW71131.1 hypothetical protein [Bordetella sp. 15P40C-2]MVW80700.1 hypothetical protein [Bordetella sp. 02P26C-1]
MLVKILIIAAFIGLILYVVLPKRRIPQAPAVPARRGRLVFSLLSSAALLFIILALFCLMLWLGGATSAISGSGEVLSGNGLLRIAGVLGILALICGITAWIKRPR